MIAPNGGVINFSQLETTWAIDSNSVFEELAKYQSRDFANLYLEQLTIEWLEIPVFIAKDKLLKRLGMYREDGFLYHALRTDNPTGEQMQAIWLSRVQMDWNIDMADSIKYLK